MMEKEQGANGCMNKTSTGTGSDARITQTRSVDVRPPPFGKQARALREASQEDRTVYLIYACGRIKIGTAVDWYRRNGEIQATCPTEIRTVRTLPGGKILEARLHKRFDEDRMHSEWFWLSPELRDFICETERGAENLREAEEEYREWLREELAHQERRNADPCD